MWRRRGTVTSDFNMVAGTRKGQARTWQAGPSQTAHALHGNVQVSVQYNTAQLDGT